MAACKKNAARLSAHMVFLDESGFLLIPPVRKTWSPRGQTPIFRRRYCHDRISAISGISVSPKRRRLGLYCHLYPINISRDEDINRSLVSCSQEILIQAPFQSLCQPLLGAVFGGVCQYLLSFTDIETHVLYQKPETSFISFSGMALKNLFDGHIFDGRSAS